MNKRFYKSLRVKNRTEFLKTIIPGNLSLKNKIGVASADSAFKLLEKIRVKKNNTNYESCFSTSAEDNIYKYIEIYKEEEITFTIKTLNTLLCFFFFKKPKKYKYAQEHSKKNLKAFFGHIEIVTGDDNDRKAFHNFIDDLELIKEDLTPLFNDLSFEISGEFEFSIIDRTDFYEDNKSSKQTTAENNKANEMLSTYPSNEIDNYKSREEFKDKNEQKLNEDIKNYYNKIVEEFSEIRLDVVNFKLPISEYVKTPIFENNKFLIEKKGKLEKKLERILKNSKEDQNQERITRKEISEIEQILSKAHNIFDVLRYGQDIFILAPAGSGKTTTLRWITHQIAESCLRMGKEGVLDFPVFVELKYYTKDVKSLNQLVSESLDSYRFKPNNIQFYNVLLLLDGYDEYGHDSKKLLKEIIEFKRKNTNSRVVFTGRVEPNFSAHNVNFITYKISNLNDKDIKKLFCSYLGDDQGTNCFDIIENIGLKALLRNPLYSAFVLVLVKDNLGQGGLDIQRIKEVIVNKALLFETLIVEKFIRSYEADKADISYESRLSYKRKEIEALTKLAFYMTYECGDTEQIKIDKAESFFKKLGSSENIIKEFKRHNILKISKEYISFDKKEVRLFFTAKQLVKSIKNYDDFLRYKNHFKNTRVIVIGNRRFTTWDYIKEYILGISHPEQLIDLSLFPKNPQRVVLTHHFFEHLKLLLSVFHQGYSSQENSYLDRNYVLKLIKINVKTYKDKKDQGYDSKDWISKYYFLRRFIKKYPFVQRFLSSTLISKVNIDFLDNLPKPDYMWFTNVSRRYNLGVSFTEYVEEFQDTYIVDNIHLDIFFLGVFEKEGMIEFSKDEITHFIYKWLFNSYGKKEDEPFKKINSASGTYSRQKFVERNLRQYFDDFILFFYQENPNPNKFTYLRLLYHLREAGWGFSIKKYTFYPKKIQQKVFEAIFTGITKIHSIQGYPYDKYFFEIVECIEDKSLKEQLSNEALSLFLSNTEDEEQKINAFILVLATSVEDNINSLMDIVTSGISKQKHIVFRALRSLTDKLRYNTKAFDQPFMVNFTIQAIQDFIDNPNSENQDLIEYLLDVIYCSSPELTSKVIALKQDNEPNIYHAIFCYLSHNTPKESINFLISQLDTEHYNTWSYDILYRIDTKYHYEFKEKFKAYSELTFVSFSIFYENPEFPMTTHKLRQLYYLCDKKSIDLFRLILNSEIHVEKLKSMGRHYYTLRNLINKKTDILTNYERTFNK